MPLHPSKRGSGQRCATPAETLRLPVCTLRYCSGFSFRSWGVGSWSSCCYFRKRQKKEKKKRRTSPSKRETSAGTRETAGFQAPGSAINQAPSRAAAESVAQLSRLLERKGKARQRHGTAELPNPGRHAGAGLLGGGVNPTKGSLRRASLRPPFYFGGKKTSFTRKQNYDSRRARPAAWTLKDALKNLTVLQ